MKQNTECQVHGAPSRTANKTLLVMLAASFSLIIRHVWTHGNAGSFLARLGSEVLDLIVSPHGIVAELWGVLPYFLAGILLAGYIRTYKLAVKLQAKLRRYGIASVFLASFIGIMTPLCACGTLTTAISLLFAGVPLAPVMALLVTSPLMSPSTYLLTLNDLGPEWTVIRTIAAFSMGVFAGVITHLLRKRGFRTEVIFIEGAIPRGDFHDEAYPDERLRCNCRERFGHRVAARTDNMFLIFLAKSSEMLWMVGKYVLVGVAVGAVVERYLPRDWLNPLFGRNDPLSIVWITLGSVPVFLHQISASSILYHIKGSLPGTLDGGAALAFMIGGPVTAMPTLVMFWTAFKKKVFALYLAVCVVGTVLIAYAFQLFVFAPHADLGNPLLKNVGALSGGSSSIIHKQDKRVRMVMDPDGKGLIATFTDEVAGSGGVVFDAGTGRLAGDGFDNRQYVRNVASWLEQNNTSPAGKRILVYTAGAESVGVLQSLLKEQGYTVRLTDRRETPLIAEALLEGWDQFWIVFGRTGPVSSISDAEAGAISRFIGQGKGALIAAGTGDLAAANRLASRYGVAFSGAVERPDRLPVAAASHFFTKASEVLGKALKFVNKA